VKIKPDICVSSIERSLEFYRDVLGFEVAFQMTGPDGKIGHAHVSWGDNQIMLDRLDWIPAEKQQQIGHGFNIYVELDDDFDIDAYYAQVRERGANITSEIQDQFWGQRHFALDDPDGYSLSFAKFVRSVSEDEMRQVLSGA
jgi:PhnB protein